MGIRGLGGFIKWKLPHVRKSFKWTKAGEGQKLGVDCSCLLYKARGAGLSPTMVIASLIVRMRRANIEPIFIFDGRPPAAKSEIIAQRRLVRQAVHSEMTAISTELADQSGNMSQIEKATMERRHDDLQQKAPSVSSGDKDEIKRLLYASGVIFLTATGEADDLLAYLCRDGTIQGVISSDTDMLARGVPTLFIPETADASVLTAIRLVDILSGLQLNYGQFVDACMLMGSDYSSKGWRCIEPRAAVEAARRGVDWTVIDVSGSVCSTMEHGVSLLSGTGVTWDQIVSEKQRIKWAAGKPPSEPATLATFAAANGWPADWNSFLGG